MEVAVGHELEERVAELERRQREWIGVVQAMGLALSQMFPGFPGEEWEAAMFLDLVGKIDDQKPSDESDTGRGSGSTCGSTVKESAGGRDGKKDDG